MNTAATLSHETLHELHDASVGAVPSEMAPAMALALAGSFGSVEHWREGFAAMARALGAEAGWLVLVFVPRTGLLFNRWVTDPVQIHTDETALLAFDADEPPVGVRVDDFLARIDWEAVYTRYQDAVHAASEGLGVELDHVDPAHSTVIDVRRRAIFEQARSMLPGARWHDPACVADWAAGLPQGQDVLVYCIYGHEVGRATALKLRGLGIPARFIAGGIDAWTTAGRPLMPKDVGP